MNEKDAKIAAIWGIVAIGIITFMYIVTLTILYISIWTCH